MYSNRIRVSTFWWNPQDRSTNYWGSLYIWPDVWTSCWLGNHRTYPYFAGTKDSHGDVASVWSRPWLCKYWGTTCRWYACQHTCLCFTPNWNRVIWRAVWTRSRDSIPRYFWEQLVNFLAFCIDPWVPWPYRKNFAKWHHWVFSSHLSSSFSVLRLQPILLFWVRSLLWWSWARIWRDLVSWLKSYSCGAKRWPFLWGCLGWRASRWRLLSIEFRWIIDLIAPLRATSPASLIKLYDMAYAWPINGGLVIGGETLNTESFIFRKFRYGIQRDWRPL